MKSVKFLAVRWPDSDDFVQIILATMTHQFVREIDVSSCTAAVYVLYVVCIVVMGGFAPSDGFRGQLSRWVAPLKPPCQT